MDEYFSITRDAMDMASENVEEKRLDEAEVILDMVSRYLSDAEHFREESNYVTAFAALNYAHGWLDCGARLGIFDVSDDFLFTTD